MLQCQKRFGGKQEVASEDDETVALLCAEWEAVMMHGLPCGKSKSRRLPLTKPKDTELGTYAIAERGLCFYKTFCRVLDGC